MKEGAQLTSITSHNYSMKTKIGCLTYRSTFSARMAAFTSTAAGKEGLAKHGIECLKQIIDDESERVAGRNTQSKRDAG